MRRGHDLPARWRVVAATARKRVIRNLGFQKYELVGWASPTNNHVPKIEEQSAAPQPTWSSVGNPYAFPLMANGHPTFPGIAARSYEPSPSLLRRRLRRLGAASRLRAVAATTRKRAGRSCPLLTQQWSRMPGRGILRPGSGEMLQLQIYQNHEFCMIQRK